MKIEWDETLSVGVAEIDDQHKLIFDKYNAFSAACKDERGAEKLNELLWFLGSYVATHFAEEERLMLRIGFADYTKHHEMHTAFAQEFNAFMENFSKEGPSPELVSTVRSFIKNWLVEHIAVMARAIGMHIKAHENM